MNSQFHSNESNIVILIHTHFNSPQFHLNFISRTKRTVKLDPSHKIFLAKLPSLEVQVWALSPQIG